MTAWHDSRMNDTLAQSNTQATLNSTFLPIKNWFVEGLRAGLFCHPALLGVPLHRCKFY